METVLNYFHMVGSELFELIDSMGNIGWYVASAVVLGLGVIFLRSGMKRI